MPCSPHSIVFGAGTSSSLRKTLNTSHRDARQHGAARVRGDGNESSEGCESVRLQDFHGQGLRVTEHSRFGDLHSDETASVIHSFD